MRVRRFIPTTLAVSEPKNVSASKYKLPKGYRVFVMDKGHKHHVEVIKTSGWFFSKIIMKIEFNGLHKEDALKKARLFAWSHFRINHGSDAEAEVQDKCA